MRRSLAATLVALSLTMTLTTTAAVTAQADTRGGTSAGARPASDPGATARQRATAALERAQSLFSRSGSRARQTPTHARRGLDATLVLRDLYAALDDLSPTQRGEARRILARPTDPGDDFPYSAPSKRKCSAHICVHWVTSSADAVPSRRWVRQVLHVMDKVWKKEVGKLGYRRPVPDGGRGGNNKLDVYLSQIGDQGYYGYCTPERRKPGFEWQASGYCVLDNDMAEFPAAPIDSARVTAAHEFFHAVQFAYDWGDDGWLLEATATWMEERVFDDINDNRQYLQSGQVGSPDVPLDLFDSFGFGQYGNWAFFELLSKRYGNGIVRSIWNKTAWYGPRRDLYSMQAISAVLKPRGGFKKFYSRFVSSNLVPRKFYPEGRTWPASPVLGDYLLSTAVRRTGEHAKKPQHLTSASYRVAPDATLSGPKWRLRVKIDGPASYRMPAASVLVVKKRGTERYFVKLNRKGNGKVVVPFSSGKVQEVYVSLVNASTRYRCNRKYAYACNGLPIDDGRSFLSHRYSFKAAAFKKR